MYSQTQNGIIMHRLLVMFALAQHMVPTLLGCSIEEAR
jgi:hypothetical protein